MKKDYKYENRRYVIGGFILVVVIIYLLRLVNLQILDPQYKESADSNAYLRKTVFPPRGAIYDRNGRLVVFNQ